MSSRQFCHTLPVIWSVLVFLGACKAHQAPPAAPPPALLTDRDAVIVPETSPLRTQITVQPVATRSLRRSLESPAEVQPDPARIARITPPLPGRIVSIAVRFGDTVAARQPLFALDSPELVAAQTDYIRARSALAQLERSLARQRDLEQHGIGARREVEQASTDRDLARSELERAGLRLKLLGIDAGSLGRPLQVISPIAGRVVEFQVAPGEYHNDLADQLMTIADLSTVWVTAHVQEKDIGRIEVNEEATIAFVAYPGKRWSGRVLFVGDLLDPDTRTIRVRVALENKDRLLRPGMFASVTFNETAAPEVVVPTQSVLLLGDANYVFVETSSWRFERRKVVPGPQTNDVISILQGLREGERIVTTNAVLLQ